MVTLAAVMIAGMAMLGVCLLISGIDVLAPKGIQPGGVALVSLVALLCVMAGAVGLSAIQVNGAALDAWQAARDAAQ